MIGRFIFALAASVIAAAPAAAKEPLRIFISVDMEGIGGIGAPAMVRAGEKDYDKGRAFMTGEVLTVIEAIRASGPAEIVVNDSHGDHQNVLHEQLPRDVIYIQGANKPYGMVEGLDETFDGAIFLGYHTRAGASGFLAHTGSGKVLGLWLNGVEVGEGGMNAARAGALGVPVLLVAGDKLLAAELTDLFPTRAVVTKEAVTSSAARLRHPAEVRKDLRRETRKALADINNAKPWIIDEPVTVRMRFNSPLYGDALQMAPGITRLDAMTVSYEAETMSEAYKLIRFMYKFVRP